MRTWFAQYDELCAELVRSTEADFFEDWVEGGKHVARINQLLVIANKLDLATDERFLSVQCAIGNRYCSFVRLGETNVIVRCFTWRKDNLAIAGLQVVGDVAKWRTGHYLSEANDVLGSE